MTCDYCDGRTKLDNGEACPMCEGKGSVCDSCQQASSEPVCEPCRLVALELQEVEV